jgi:hypothetical protein
MFIALAFVSVALCALVVLKLRSRPVAVRATAGGPGLAFATVEEGGSSAPAAPAPSPRASVPIDVRALGLSDTNELLGPITPETPIADLLVYAFDAGNSDPVEAILSAAQDDVTMLDCAQRDPQVPPCEGACDRVVLRIERRIEVAAELHRRQIAALRGRS